MSDPNESLLAKRVAELEAAIAKHHAQHADDMCWLDDMELYEAAGLSPKDNSVGDPCAMLENCKRFIEQRCKPGGGWKSYAELEAENERLRNEQDPFSSREEIIAYLRRKSDKLSETPYFFDCLALSRAADALEGQQTSDPVWRVTYSCGDGGSCHFVRAATAQQATAFVLGSWDKTVEELPPAARFQADRVCDKSGEVVSGSW